MSGAAQGMASFRSDHRRDGEVTVVTVAGELDIFTAPRLREVLVEQIEAGHVRLVLDVDQVTFLDSTAVAVLIGAWWRVRDRGGHLALAGAPEPVRTIFHVTCLTHDLALFDTTDEALRACHAGTACPIPRDRRRRTARPTP
jgi:anti-sigma B factor antagonist